MKIIIIVILVLAGIIIIGCKAALISGSGNVTEDIREVGSFDSIHVSGIGNLYISEGETTSVKIKTDDNLHQAIKTKVSKNKLKIYQTKAILRSTEMNFYVTVPDLKEIHNSGSCNAYGDIINKEGDLTINISGSGKMSLNLEVSLLQTKISGSGSVQLKGSANDHTITITGSGDINAFNCHTLKTSAKISGSGKCQVNAVENLDVTISGSGKVFYKGTPKITSNISGSGKLQAIEE